MLSILATTVATPEKWPWTVGSLQYLTNPADAHGGGEPARVDLGNVRDEQHVRAALLGQPGVPLLVSRVGRQVGRLVELARVDEQPHHDKVGGCPGRSDQRKVPVVEPPMVGTKATVPWPGSSARTSAMACMGPASAGHLGRARHRGSADSGHVPAWPVDGRPTVLGVAASDRAGERLHAVPVHGRGPTRAARDRSSRRRSAVRFRVQRLGQHACQAR